MNITVHTFEMPGGMPAVEHTTFEKWAEENLTADRDELAAGRSELEDELYNYGLYSETIEGDGVMYHIVIQLQEQIIEPDVDTGEPEDLPTNHPNHKDR